MTEMTREEANKLIAEKVAAAYALINECEALATEHGLSFSFDLSYGMGGTFQGEDYNESYYKTHPDQRPPDWTSSFEPGWQASSQSC